MGKLRLILGEVLDDPERGPHLLEGVEDQAQRLLDLLVGIEDDLAGGVVDQPGGRPEAELAGSGLLQLAPQQPRPDPVQLGFAHGALDPQEQAVVVLSRIIDAVLVDDEGVGQATDLDEAIPVAAGTGQARGFQAQDGADAAETDLGHQVLEAVATEGGGPGVSLVLVDDLDVFLGPSELVGASRQVVLAGGAGEYVAHLHGGRLPDVDQGLAVEMLGPDLGGASRGDMVRSPCGSSLSRWATRLEARSRHESDGAGLGLGGEPVPDLGGRDRRDREMAFAIVHKNTSPIETRERRNDGDDLIEDRARPRG